MRPGVLASQIAIAISVLFSNTSAGQDLDVRAAIDAGNAAYIAAMENADARAFAAVYDLDAARLGGGGEVVRGRGAIMDQIGGFFTRVGPVEVTIETAEVWTIDDRAYESGKWTYTFTPAGSSRRTVSGRYVTVWKLQEDGSWKILVDISVPGTEG